MKSKIMFNFVKGVYFVVKFMIMLDHAYLQAESLFFLYLIDNRFTFIEQTRLSRIYIFEH